LWYQGYSGLPISKQTNAFLLDQAIGTNTIQAVLGTSIIPSFAANKLPVGNNNPVVFTNGLNNAQLANQMIAASTASNTVTSNQVNTRSTPITVATYNPRTGQTVNLVRSSMLAPKSSSGKRSKI
jgi:hypothetical protein